MKKTAFCVLRHACFVAAFLAPLAPAPAVGQGTPPSATGYRYCIGLFGQFHDQCWGSTAQFSTPAEVCEDDLRGTRERLPAWQWWMDYFPGPTDAGWLGYAPHGWCSKRSHTGFGNAAYLIARIGSAPEPLVIDISGGSATKALPAGPALPQMARVTRSGVPVAGVTVQVSAGTSATAGVSDANGQFTFNYVPPVQRSTVATVTASCTGCSNTASKQVTVTVAETCENLGNPIQPATGGKVQREVDWADMAPHPLNFARQYSSHFTHSPDFGPGWGHEFSARADAKGNDLVVRFGGGASTIFSRSAQGAPWTEPHGGERLAEMASGWVLSRADDSRWMFDTSGRLVSITQRNGWTYNATYDALGRLARITNAFGRSLSFTRDGAGRVAGIAAPDGAALAYAYDAAGRLSAVTGPAGTRHYHYEDARNPAALTGITDEAGVRIATFGYDEHGRAVQTEHAGQAGRFTIEYPPTSSQGSVHAGSLVDPMLFIATARATDPNGFGRTLSWKGGDGTLTQVGGNHPDSGVASRVLGPGNLPLNESDFAGTTTEFSWDASRKLQLSVTRAAGKPEAQTTQYEWHSAWRLPVLVREAHRSTAFTYDDRGNVLGRTMTDTRSGAQRSWAWTYDARNLPLTMTDPRGGVWQYDYDAAGNRITERDPAGRRTTFTYDAAGRVLTRTEPGGSVTRYTWDPAGRLVSENHGGETSRYAYAPFGQLLQATLPGGYSVRYSYDSAQRLVAAQDNRGASVSYTLDGSGNRVREEVRDASGAIALVTSRIINNLNRVAALEGARGQRTSIDYDANGRPVTETDPLNQTTRQVLDALGRTGATIFPDNSSTTNAWNQLDQLVQVTDPKGVATQYDTNAFGEVTIESSPDMGTVAYQRDAAGEVVGMRDAKGQLTQIDRDPLGRVTAIRYADGAVATFEYDEAGFVARMQDRSGGTEFARDAQGRVLAKSQTVQEGSTFAGTVAVGYALQAGQLSAVMYPSGLSVTYQRDPTGRIVAVHARHPGQWLSKPRLDATIITGISYTALGQPRSWSWSNGAAAARTFDADGRMTANEFATYAYDAAGRITGITQKLWVRRGGGKQETFTPTNVAWTVGYDRRNRVIRFERAGASTQYTYDANSNRLTAVSSVTSDTDLDGEFGEGELSRTLSQVLDVDAGSNRLLGLTQTATRTKKGKTTTTAGATVAYAVDANGALTSDGMRSFEYDGANRLARVRIHYEDNAGSTIRYLHNAAGQRVFRSEPAPEFAPPDPEVLGEGFVAWLKRQFGSMFTAPAPPSSLGTIFLYADNEIPSWALLGEYDTGTAQGKGRTEYIWLPLEDGSAIPVGLYRNGKLYAVHTDHLGTPRLITDDEKRPVWQWPYSAFGDSKPTGPLQEARNGNKGESTLIKATHPIDFALRFPGQREDEDAGMFYNYYRDYAEARGRYAQPDPIGLRGGLNRFTYADNTPTGAVDPLGLAVEWSGGINTMGATTGLGGQLSFFTFTSECKCGKRVKIRGFASFITLGAGASLKGVGKFFEDASGASSATKLIDDWADCPDPTGANGSAWQSGVNAVFGAGGTLLPALKLGRLRMRGVLDGPAYGFDLSLTSTFWGQSVVTSYEVEECCESK